MGISSQPSFASLALKDLLDRTEEHSNSSFARKRRTRRILMRGGCRRSSGTNGIQTRVRRLKRLVPNSESVMGLDGLFRETADYILSLQTRVRVMQVMVEVLTGSDDV